MLHQLLSLVLLAGLCYAGVPLLHANNENVIPDSYIVVFRPTVTEKQMEARFASLEDAISIDSPNISRIVAKYSFGDFKGFSAILSPSLLEIVRGLTDEVKFVEADQVMTINQACAVQQTTEWGLDRISERQLDLDGQYVYDNSAGQGVDAYIIDTGIRVTHKEFSGGRAQWGANFADKENTDCNGHGTHVAGTVGGTTYGVAKKTTLWAVKVLSCTGSGTNTGVIQGVQWAATKASQRKKPSVANMSLGGGASTALDSAVKTAINGGVTFVLAAGNENRDACLGSPADVGGKKGPAITVGATTVADSNGGQEDKRASFSNYGQCLDVFAPGQLITSAWYTSDTAINTISGTSMASPHVAGAVALYLSENNGGSPSAIKADVASSSTKNGINLACGSLATCQKSPNNMLYAACS